MEKDFREIVIGSNLPFSIPNLTKNIIKMPIEAECSSFRILINDTNSSACSSTNHIANKSTDSQNTVLSNKLKYLRQKDSFSPNHSNILIYGFIIKKGTKIPITVINGVPNITFSCFDEIYLYFFEQTTQNLFFSRFSCCKNWGTTKLIAHEVAWIGNDFSPSSNCIEVPLEITNLRSGYHYNVSEVRSDDPKKHMSKMCFEIDSARFLLEDYKCPLCLQLCSHGHRSLDFIANHINLVHKRYSAEVKDCILQIACIRHKKDLKQTRRPFVGPQSKKIEYNLKPMDKSIDSIDFDIKCDLGSNDEKPGSYVDFLSGITPDQNTSQKNDEISEPEKQLSKDYTGNHNNIKLTSDNSRYYSNDTIDEMYDYAYHAAESPCDLARQIFLNKENSRAFSCTKKLVEFFYISDSFSHFRSNTPKPISKKLYKSVNCYIKASFSSNLLPSEKDFTFFKSRDTKLFEYSFINYGLLIENEFDKLDYSNMLSSHLNCRLNNRSSFLNPKELKLMKEWNRLRLGTSRIPDCLRQLVAALGLTNEVLKFIEILYNRGIITSSDIMDSLSDCGFYRQ